MLIYCIEFPNGKKYVGKTECDLSKRQKEHKHHSKYKRTRLYNAIKKYGWDNLAWSVLEECDCPAVLNEREVYWISHFSCLDHDSGYNLREGGTGGRHSEETKQKISKSNSGENNGMYGRSSWNAGMKMSEEYKKKLSEAHKGQVPWNKGIKGKYKLGSHSEESKAKMSETKKILSMAERTELYDLFKSGIPAKDLSEKYSLHITTVYRYIKRQKLLDNI